MLLFSSVLVFLFTSHGTFASTKNKCSVYLRADVHDDQYLEAVRRTGVPRSSYTMARGQIRKQAERLELNDEGKSDFFSAVSARVLNYEERAKNLIAKIISEQNSPRLTSQVIDDSLDELAVNPNVASVIAMLDFTNGESSKIEIVLYHYSELIDDLKIGARQTSAVRTVLKYANLQPGDKILEIGFGTPAALLALVHQTAATGIGVDSDAHWSQRNQELMVHGVEANAGRFPDDRTVNYLKSQGPFAAIYAQDVYLKYLDRRSMEVIYDLLKPGGVFVLINDYAQSPRFSEAQALAMGFEILHREGLTIIPDIWKSLMNYSDDQINAGQLSRLVLSRGPAPTQSSPGRLL